MWDSEHKFQSFIWAHLFENVVEHGMSPKMFSVRDITDSAEIRVQENTNFSKGSCIN